MGRWRWFGVAASLVMCGGGTNLGCSSEGDGSSSAGLCAQAEQRLRSCDLITPGPIPCTEPREPEKRCVLNCVLQGNCSQIRDHLCSATGPVTQCVSSCRSFRCGDGTMIPEFFQCDGAPDCVDGSDEQGCEFFICQDGGVAPSDARCNGYSECVDGSDELGCATFTCADGYTILADWRCDGYPDCYDGSDEFRCPGYFTCQSGDFSVPPDDKCDGYTDCPDASDELGCPELAELKCE